MSCKQSLTTASNMSFVYTNLCTYPMFHSYIKRTEDQDSWISDTTKDIQRHIDESATFETKAIDWIRGMNDWYSRGFYD